MLRNSICRSYIDGGDEQRDEEKMTVNGCCSLVFEGSQQKKADDALCE